MSNLLSSEAVLKSHVTQRDRILLVNPPVEETRYSWLRWNQPLDLLTLSAYLKKHVGCKVELLDFMKPDARGKVLFQRIPGSLQDRFVGEERYPMRRYGLPYSTLTSHLVQAQAKRKNPTQIWVTSLCSFWFHSVAQVCRIARQAAPDTQILLLGNYARLLSGHATTACPADIVVSEANPISGIPAKLTPYGRTPPPFLALRLDPKTAMPAIRDAVQRGVYRFTFFEEDVCQEGGTILQEIIRKAAPLHRNVRFHIICGLRPSGITPELAGLFADKAVHEIHLEQEGEEQLETAVYEQACAYLREAHVEIPSKAVSGFLWMGRPGDTLDDLITRCLTLLNHFGTFILKPFSPTPGSPVAKKHARYLKPIPPQDWSPHVFPFSEHNEITRAEYSDLYRMAAFLTDKVRGKAFDFLNGSLGTELLKNSLRREVWNIGSDSSSTTD